MAQQMALAADVPTALARLRDLARAQDCAIFAVGGPDALDDVGCASILSYALPPLAAFDSEMVLLVTPSGVGIHCTSALWAGSLQPALEEAFDGTDDLDIVAHVPELGLARDDLLPGVSERCEDSEAEPGGIE